MSADVARREPPRRAPDSREGRKARDLLDQCVGSSAPAQGSASLRKLEQAVRLAEAAGAGDVVCRAAAWLGLLHIERGDLEQAVEWLEWARGAAAGHRPPAWLSLLSALAGVGRAEAAARDADRQMAETRTQLAREIDDLAAQVREVSAHLGRELRQEWAADASAPPTTPRQDGRRSPGDGRPALTVRALGTFEAHLADDAPLALCTNRKGQALFKVLAAEPHTRRHKESLLLQFWPDEPPAAAAGKLHVAASRLRRSLVTAGLGRDVLRFEEDCYFLNDDLRVSSDVVHFDEHCRAGQRLAALNEPDLAAAEYEAALALYQGPFLAEVVGEDWPLVERTRLEEQSLVALTNLAAWYFDKGRYLPCAECCRRILDHDSLREDVCRQLMRCLSRAGQRNQALRLYHDCERELKQELGVAPMPETTRLFEQIRQGQIA